MDSDEHLTFADVVVNDRDNPTILQVHLKTSKTDPFRSGVDVFVRKTGNDLCPVTAMVNYLGRRGSRDGALFAYEDGRCPTRENLVVRLRPRCVEILQSQLQEWCCYDSSGSGN